MHHLLQGASGKMSCVYIALDALLGSKWSQDSRDFCAGIIADFNGFPSQYNYIIPEFAPVQIWSDNFNVQYEQPETYVRMYRNGWRYRIHKNTNVCLSYIYENNYGIDVGHMTCVPIRSMFELKFKTFLALITADGTQIIKDRE